LDKRQAPIRCCGAHEHEQSALPHHLQLHDARLRAEVQAKIREGKGEGYRQWAAVFNLKQMAKTLIWLQENGIDSYDDLKQKAAAASQAFRAANERLKTIETRQKSIAELQKQIGVYGKTRSTYVAYIKSGKDPAFCEANRADVVLCEAAKKFFDAQGFKTKLPSINSLKQEWATLEAERKSLYSGYRERKENYAALTTARANAERILGITPDRQIREPERTVTPKKSHDCGAR
jgi:hypothetical protein